MVLRDKFCQAPPAPVMASDQPVKKKQRIDAPDLADTSIAYDAIFSTSRASSAGTSPDSGTLSEDAVDCASGDAKMRFSAPSTSDIQNGIHNPYFPFNGNLHSPYMFSDALPINDEKQDAMLLQDFDEFQEHLVKQCLCGLGEDSMRRPLHCRMNMAEWPPDRVLVFLSNLQLLFDVYLKQNYKGSICTRLMDVCDALVRNEDDWLTEVINLADHRSKFVNFLASRVVSSFLIVAKDNIDHNWLQKIIENVYLFDTINSVTVRKINFSLDVIKRVVEWKDVDQHPLEDSAYINSANPVSTAEQGTSGVDTRASDNNLHDELSNLHTAGNVDPLTARIDEESSSNASTNDRERSPFKLHEPVLKFPVSQPIGAAAVTPVYHGSESSARSESSRVDDEDEIEDADSLDPHRCVTISVTDSESFDTSHIKCLTIKCLERHWPALVGNVRLLLTRYLNIVSSENCILTFLSLWENIISVKANLSVVDTKPFYMDLQSFVELLRCTNLPSLIYTQLLSLFNEVLCYGSTLALQDILPEETCTLAHNIVRFVKDFRLLNDIRLRHSRTGFGFISYDSDLISSYSLEPQFIEYAPTPAVNLVDPSYGEADISVGSEANPSRSERTTIRSETDKTMLQKMVLLVLKSVAVTVKELRCDSSDSSIDSTDYNAIQDMQMVERSIRDVLKKLDVFLKSALDFLPESPFTKILIHLFSEQDDYLIESMVCTLDITVGIVYRNSMFPDLIPMLNPILTFLEFLDVVSYDSEVLLDYLVSNETCFLLYLLRFLKYVRRNWSKFVLSYQWEQGTSGTRGLEDTMAVLIRLRLQISRLVSKSLFPYNISPVLRLLEVCESLYEGNELS